MNDAVKNVLEHIQRVKKFALMEEIKVNTIIIDKEIAKVNGFIMTNSESCSYTKIPTTILGLKVLYSENLSDEFGTPVNFAMTQIEEPKYKTPLSEYSVEELLEELRYRYEEETNNDI